MLASHPHSHILTFSLCQDAIDGKHARNTKQSSAVGSWLDHGFDAMTLVYQTVYALYALNVPTWNLWAVIATVMSQCAWTSVWVEKKMTGVMRFPLMADVEGNMFVMAINVVNAYMPFWRSFMRSTAFVLPVMGGLEIPGYG
jgi:phosphatidylglycerophosphate synthase